MTTLAVFDFDHTLIEGDSFWTFLRYVGGAPHLTAAIIASLTAYALNRLAPPHDADAVDFRTFIKGELMRRILAGKTLSQLAAAAEKTRRQQKWLGPMHDTLLEHHAAGHHIVIASGALDVYLSHLVIELPHHGLLCTETGVRNGVVTGTMPSGNCVREGKAAQLRAYIALHGPFAESWGYGNFPHDLPMLNLLKHRVIV